MQHNDAARAAVLPEGARWSGMQNGDILRMLGLDNREIESLNQTSRANGEDSLVTYCRQKGIATLEGLLT